MVGDGRTPLDLLQCQPRGQHETSVGRTGSIKQSEGVRVFTNHYGDGVVIEDLTTNSGSYTHVHGIAYSGDIFARKLVRSVRYQKTRQRDATHFATRTIADDYTLDRLHFVGTGLW